MFSSLMNYAKGAAQPEEEEIRVEKLLIHPIKSARGISVDSAEYDQRENWLRCRSSIEAYEFGTDGFKLDRRWLIIDSRTNWWVPLVSSVRCVADGEQLSDMSQDIQGQHG